MIDTFPLGVAGLSLAFLIIGGALGFWLKCFLDDAWRADEKWHKDRGW